MARSLYRRCHCTRLVQSLHSGFLVPPSWPVQRVTGELPFEFQAKKMARNSKKVHALGTPSSKFKNLGTPNTSARDHARAIALYLAAPRFRVEHIPSGAHTRALSVICVARWGSFISLWKFLYWRCQWAYPWHLLPTLELGQMTGTWHSPLALRLPLGSLQDWHRFQRVYP